MTIPVSASPKDGYKLDTITATAKHTVEETSGSGQAEVQGTYLANDNLSQILLTVGTQP